MNSVINEINNTDILLDIYHEILSYIETQCNNLITFKSLTFSSINVMTDKIPFLILQSNNQAQYILHTPHNGDYKFNINYSSSYYGDINKYMPKFRHIRNEQYQSYQLYTIQFLNKNRIKLILNIDLSDKKFLPGDRFISFDTNIKHNILACHDGNCIYYDKQLLYHEKQLQKLLKRINANKKLNNNKLLYGKQIHNHINKQLRRREFHKNKIAALAVKYAIKHGYNHIILEDLELQNIHGSQITYDKSIKNLTTNNIIDALRIRDLKNSIQRIAAKYNVSCSLVNPRFTSCTCPICGNIDSNNRKIQEQFQCTNCGYQANADFVAALNILIRVAIPELCNILEYRSNDRYVYQGKNYKNINIFKQIYNDIYNNPIVKCKILHLISNYMEDKSIINDILNI